MSRKSFIAVGLWPRTDSQPASLPADRQIIKDPIRSQFRCLVVLTCLFCLGCPTSRSPARVSRDEEHEVSANGAAKLNSTLATADLLERIESTLEANREGRRLDVSIHGAWQIMHGLLAYGDDLTIQTPSGEQPALEYVLAGNRVRGAEAQTGDPIDGKQRFRFELEPTSKQGQGHRDQWLAILAQCDLPAHQPLEIDNQTFLMEDLLTQCEYDTPLNFEEEFSWTLIGLLHYRDTDHVWTARDGERYSIELLVNVELVQPLQDSVCGGTHRLIGLATARNRRQQEGKSIDGVWAEVDDRLQAAIELARQNQNADGSYSLAYLHRPGRARDLSEQLGTTGHVLEFLAFAADQPTLESGWVRRAAVRICDLLDRCQTIDLECGVLYHALHGLQEYRARLVAAREPSDQASQ